jgi:hypothetical protein
MTGESPPTAMSGVGAAAQGHWFDAEYLVVLLSVQRRRGEDVITDEYIARKLVELTTWGSNARLARVLTGQLRHLRLLATSQQMSINEYVALVLEGLQQMVEA